MNFDPSSVEVKRWFEYFISALAALSAAATIVGLLFQMELNGLWPWFILAFILFVCIIYSCLMTHEKKHASLRLSERWTCDIKEGDIFSCKGVVAIPVNEYFDTKVDDIIIARRSLHGQFITRFFENAPKDLSAKIKKSLKGITPMDIVKRDGGLPSEKYAMGTCADIQVGDTLYVLFVVTHFDGNNHCYLGLDEYSIVTSRLITHLESVANMREVFIPLYGTGQSGLNKSSQRVLSFLVDNLDFLSPRSFPGGFSIILRDIEDMEIHLNKIK